jgi:hypothetical protein
LKKISYIKRHVYIIYACFQLSGIAVRCQDNAGDVYTLLKQYHQNSTKEKLFVHTDKNFYVAGEILWFKIYAVDATTHRPLKLSKVAYVEILDSLNKHVLQAKIALNSAEGNGSFYLPAGINSGNFKLRAYTSWMKNFRSAYFFEKNISIINANKRIELPAQKRNIKYEIQFFPEGGNLVNNIASKIAFKATDQFGKGIKFTGVLLDNNDTLLKFEPQHAGMGFFTLKPESGHSYKAVVYAGGGEAIIRNLPEVYSGGYVMALRDSSGKIRVIVKSDISRATELYLLAHTREQIKVAQSGNLENGAAVFIFDRDLLGDGISDITIFNDQKQPLCERLYFKRPSKQLHVQLNSGVKEYAPRNKVSITVQTSGSGNEKDSASLSMTVVRLDSLQSTDAANINSFLLLTSDLNGFVEDPNYYFLHDDQETNTALDNLMLTNGWRRFRWEEVLKNTKPTFQFAPEYNGAIISGNVINAKTHFPGNDVDAYISAPGIITAFSPAVSDSEGHLAFELKNLYGPSQLVLQTIDSIYKISISDPFSNSFAGNPYPAFSFNLSFADALRQQSINMQVQNIYSAKNIKQFISPVIDTTPFYIHADQKYLLDNYTRFTTMEEVLREYVILVNVRKKEGRFHLGAYDADFHRMFNDDPLVLLDGVPVLDLDKFMQVDPLKLNRLEVLDHRYFLGRSSFEGVLSWTSYKQDLADYDLGPHAVTIDYEGLQAEREFYSPVYDTQERQESHFPDFRNVLLWAPHIKMAVGSSKEITFYTSDLPGKYFVEIQGLSDAGLCGSQQFTIEVKK